MANLLVTACRWKLPHLIESILNICQKEQIECEYKTECVDSKMRPLHFAIFHGYDELAKKLILMGADVNVRDKNNQTPLFYAIYFDRISIAFQLLLAGATISEMPKLVRLKNSSSDDLVFLNPLLEIAE